ncbi:hypothetical protein ACFVYR_15430 [Streptomyces sp. NPDC058284]|uniref:hypothetical protein n=1 Tax=unclassified Streptomyces TaxID=2593676 RepID=UPI0036574ED3
MGALRRLRGRGAATRRSAFLYAVGLAGAAALGVTACDPVNGDMNSSAVALTTDELGTRALERQHTGVAWLSCTARFADKATSRGRTARDDSMVKVDCQGETDGGKDISIKGEVRSVVDGDCVRGNLTAKVDGKQRFRVDVLGNCSSGGGGGGGGHPTSRPTFSHHPPPSHEQPRPAPTTTVTVTVTADPPARPTCECVPGK